VHATERLSDRYERLVRYGEAHQSSPLQRRFGQVQVMRALLRLAAKEGVQLRHGTVKHARDLIRYQEKRCIKE